MTAIPVIASVYAFALVCTLTWLLPSAFASLETTSSTNLNGVSVREHTNSLSSSAFSLPGRSVIISTLIDYYAINRNLRADSRVAKFSSINQIFNRVSIKLPDAKVSKSGLDLTITNIVCRNLNVQDIQLSHNDESITSQRLNINIEGLKIDCSFDFGYKWSFFNGSGSGRGELDPSSSARIGVQFTSENYDTHPPHDVIVESCNPAIKIKAMEFSDLGVLGGILNLFEGLLKETVQDELATTVCTELKGLGDGAFDDLLLMLSSRTNTYLEPLDTSLTNPLMMENTTQVPMIDFGEDIGEPLYLNFQELEAYTGEWINSALDQVDSLLGPSESEPFGQLGINKFIRDNLLDDNGKLVVDPSLFSNSGVIFEGHDMLTQTTMAIQSILIEGADSFKEMNVLNAIGNHTLQNKVKLNRLHIVIEMEAEIKASSLDNAVIVANNAPPIEEKFTIDFTMSGIEIDASVFLGINTETLGNLELGSMLYSQNIIPCLLSAVDDAKFTGISASVLDMSPPKLSGFIDGGIDHLISTGAAALFEMYEKVLIKAMPNFFEINVRDMVNGFIDDASDIYKCPGNENVELDSLPPPLASDSAYIDFRDMFLPSSEAALIGGSGDGRHGDVIPWVMGIMEDKLLSADNEGLVAINDVLVAPFTKLQSGVEGALKLNGTLLDLNQEKVTRDIWKAFADNLRLSLSDLSISGLDTLRSPIKFLEPRSSSPHLLGNQLTLGASDKPLDVSVQFGIQVGGATSPLATDNIMDLQLSMPSMEILAVVFATVHESSLMKFPLKDLTNFSCWLSKIPISAESPTIDVGFAMHYLDLLLDGEILATANCVKCSNAWLSDLNSMIEFLNENKFISGLKTKALAVMSEALQGDWAQGLVDKQISAASQRCPHDSAFGSPASDQTTYPAFKATRQFVDGILYAAFPLVQSIAVVIAQKHANLEVAPLADIELDVPDGANLIDLTDLSSVAGWADMALKEVRSYLGGLSESNNLGITSMLQSLALDDNGLLTIAIEDQGFEAGGVKLSLYDITMVGLDSFTFFDVLKASGPNTFGNSVKLQRLGVTLRMGLSVEDDSSVQGRMLSELGHTENGMETITVSLILKDVDLDVSLLIAMDQNLVGELTLGSILDTNHIFSCLLSTIHSVGLSEFLMHIGDIEEFSISGFISEDTNRDIQSMTEAILEEYKPLVLNAIPAFTSNTIRPILHDIMQMLVDTAKYDDACPAHESSHGGILDFRDLLLSEERALELLGRGDSPYGNLFQLLFSFLEEMMSKTDENGLSDMNVLLASMTERQSNEKGELYYPGDLFSKNLDIDLNGLKASIELGVSDLRVSNIDSLDAPVKMLQPVKGETSVLNNTASVGAGSKPFRTELRLLIKGKGEDVEVHNDLMLGLSLENVGMALEVLAQINELSFANFPLQDVLNLQCWLATVASPVLNKYGTRVGEEDSGMVLRSLALAVAEARLDIECISCSSPLIVEMASELGSKDSVEDTTTAANMILDYLSNLLGGDFVQSGLDKMLNEAAMKCPHNPSYNQNFSGLKYEELISPEKSKDSYGFLIAIIAVIAICAIAVSIIIVAANWASRRRHNRWLNTLTMRQKLELEKMQTDEKEREKDLNARMSSLVTSKEVPLFLRLFIPIVIIGNIALFLSGHLSLGGTVNISGTFAGQEFDVQGFFEFSMAKSTIEMWNAGAKSLAILIVIFSGAWPYSKLLVTLFIWFAPPRWLSSNRRGKLLHWLDVLGKWSMVDVFVLLMTLASFRLSIASPNHLNFLPEGLYSINMLVVPLWGLYANMLAQFVAQILSHVIIHYHRKTSTAAAHSQEVDWDLPPSNSDSKPENLRTHSFKLDYEVSSKRAVVRRSVNWILSAALLLFVMLLVFGCALPSFGIEVLGLVGLVVESGNRFEQAQSFYSVFDLATMIMDQARYLNTASDLVGLGSLASLLVITVFLVPLAQAASLFAQWFVPMTKKQRMWVTVSHEILGAWQYMEVYVLSIVIAAWQLGGVSEYIINAYCGPLESTFSSLSYHGILSEDDAQCFRVDATVESASWILVAASLILCILNHFIAGASSQKAQDDDIPTEQRLHTDRWLQSKQSAATIHADISLSMSNGDEEGFNFSEPSEVYVSPVKPRFTDYYFFATARRTEEQYQDCAAETAIVPVNSDRSNK